MRSRFEAFAVIVLCSSFALAEAVPDFSGTWRRDVTESPATAFGPPAWVIKQNDHELILKAGGQTFVFHLDGTERVYVDESLGDLPGFVRKIRTKANWSGSTLLTERTSFAEQRNPQTGEITTPAGAITIVESIHLSSDGRSLIVEHSGYRTTPPELLHGKAYDRDSDPAAKQYKDVFRRIGP